MLEQAYAAALATSLALGGLLASNLLYDRGIDAAVSRSLAAFGGGLAFLIVVLLMSFWPALVLASAMTGLMLGLRFRDQRRLRGSTGHLVGQAWSHVTFGLIGVVSLIVG